MASSIPTWFPTRFLVVQGIIALCALLFCLAPLWYFSRELDIEVDGLRNRLQVQQTLSPLMEGLDGQRRDISRLLGTQKALPTPETLPDIVTSLQELTRLSGLESARFVPAAETVVERNSIRLDGTLSGGPDPFRKFILLLSDQPWISGMEFLNLTPTATLPSYTVGLWATFKQPQPALAVPKH